MAFIIFRITKVIICAIVVCLRVIYHDSVMFPILGFYWNSVWIGWRFIQGLLNWFICSPWSGSAAIPGMSRGTSTWGWSSMWGVVTITISTGVMASWSTPMVASTLPVISPGMASMGVVMTMASISVWLGLWPGSAVPVSVPVMVSGSWSGAMHCVGILSLMTCRCTWWWYPIWTIHYYMTIFITLKTLDIWTVSCYMTWLLTLETAVSLMRSYIYSGWR